MNEEVETVEETQKSGAEYEELITQLKEQLASREKEVAQLQEQLAIGIERYRAQVLTVVPEIPGELVTGATVEEIDASLAKAQQMVDKVKRNIEAQRAQERIPAGAPVRMAPDLSGLSPRDKIAYALGRQQR